MTSKLISRMAAANAGKTRYFTGLPCVCGHIAERMTSTGGCVECNRERRQTPAVKEKLRVYIRGYNRQVRARLKEARAQAER